MRGGRLALQFSHSFLEELGVQIEPHGGDVAVLLGAEQVPRPADLEVAQGQLEAGAELRQLLDDPEPPLRRLVQAAVGRDHEIRVRLEALPPDPAPELVELGQAEAVGPVDDDGVRRGDVESRLHDRRGDEHVGLAIHELHHDGFQLPLGHLSMRHHDTCNGAQPLDEGGHGREGLHPVVDEEDLAPAVKLPLDRVLDHGPAEAGDDRLDGQPVERRCLDHRQVADSCHGHVERAWDGRGGEREDVHRGSHLLDALLVGDAEAVLLVHHEQPQPLALDVLGQEPVGADDHVHRAAREPRQHGLLRLGTPEAREKLDPCREGGEAVREGVEVLLGQHRRGDEDGDLAPVGDHLERGAQSHLGLAVAHVPRHEPVHGPGVLHVRPHVLDGAHLIGRLLEPEGRIELTLPRRVGWEGVALGHRAGGIEPEQLLGHLAQRRPHRLLHALPGPAAQPVEPGGALGGAHVLGDQVQPIHRQIEPPALGVLEQEEVGVASVHRHGPEPVVAADPVGLVDHQVAGREVREGRDGRAPLEQRPAQPAAAGAEDLLLGEDDEPEGRELEPGRAVPDENPQPLGAPEPGLGPGRKPVLRKDLPQALGLRLVGDHETHGKALAAPALELGGESLELAVESADGARPHGDALAAGSRLGDQRQVEPLEGRERPGERHGGRRVVGRRLEQPRVHENGKRVERQVRRERGLLAAAPEREHRQVLDLLDGALGRRVEEAEGLHVVAEELDTHGMLPGGREDVHDPPAQAPLPDVHHGLDALVSPRREPIEQHLALDRLAEGETQRLGPELSRRGQRRGQRGRRAHDREGLSVEQPMAHEHALGVVLAVAAPPGRRRGRRELDHPGARRGGVPGGGER